MSAIDATPQRAAAGTAELLPEAPPAQHAHRGRLFRKYLLLILSLVSLALLVSGGISLYFTYRETTAALASLQHEKAVGAASRIEQYLRQVSQQLQYAALPQIDAGDVELRRIEFLKLLRQAPEVTDISLHRRRRARADRRVAPGHGRGRLGQGPLGRSRPSSRPSAASPGTGRCTSARRPSPT